MTRERLKYQMQLAMSEHHSGNSAEAQRIVDAILAAIEAAGVRLVPSEATDPMWTAGNKLFNRAERLLEPHLPEDMDELCYEVLPGPGKIYEAMLAASPYAPAQKDETK